MKAFRASISFGIHVFVGSEVKDRQPVSSPMGGRKSPHGVLGGSRGRMSGQGCES